MRGRALSRLYALALVAIAFAACAPVSQYVPADAPALLAAPAARVGDFWEYAVRDGYSGAPQGLYRYEVVQADAQNVVVDVYRDGQRADTFVYAPGWNPREMPLTNLQRFRYDPPFPAYEYPLERGKTWYRVVTSTDPVTKKSYRTHIQARVVGWERLRVPAGDFDALRVARQVFAGNAEFFNRQEEIVQTDWFAPGVRQAVRSEAASSHIDTSRSGGPRRPMVVRGNWLIAELTRFSVQ